MVDRKRKKLDAHPARSKVAIAGGCAVLFGLPFFGVGLFLLLAALGEIPLKSRGGHPPLFLLVLLAIVFGVPGLFLIGHGINRDDADEVPLEVAPEGPPRPGYGTTSGTGPAPPTAASGRPSAGSSASCS